MFYKKYNKNKMYRAAAFTRPLWPVLGAVSRRRPPSVTRCTDLGPAGACCHDPATPDGRHLCTAARPRPCRRRAGEINGRACGGRPAPTADLSPSPTRQRRHRHRGGRPSITRMTGAGVTNGFSARPRVLCKRSGMLHTLQKFMTSIIVFH